MATTISIPHPEEVFNSVYRPFVENHPETRKPLVLFEGGRGSAKSKEIAHGLVLRSLERKLRIALVRKVANTIRQSQYYDIKLVVQEWGIEQYFTFIESRLEILVANGSQFICLGLDKVEKTKSLSSVDIVWIEEATELTKNDWDTFRFTIRGSGEILRQKVLSWNRQTGNWTESQFFNADQTYREDSEVYHLHTTYRDNGFLDEAFLRDISRLQSEDPELYKKVAEGMPVRLQGLIFNNWRVIDEFPENCDEVIYGIDFGVSDPTVVCRVGIRERDLFIDELFYERGKTNQDLLEILPELIPIKTRDIYADNEDPNRIEEIYRAGFNVKPAVKGPNSVIEGIAFLRGYTLHLTARSANGRRDFENYKWKTDKNGLSIVPETPMHAFSHFPDAVRYAVFSHLSGTPVFTHEDARHVRIEPLMSDSLSGWLP